MTIKSPLKQILSNVDVIPNEEEELLDVSKPKLSNDWRTCFDPVNTSVSSESPLLLKRVHFGTDEDDSVLETKYEDTRDHDFRSQWYSVADFRSFRVDCHAMAAKAAADEFYVDYFEMLYRTCQESRDTVPTMDLEDAREFSDYRGIERVIFRHYLQSDKIASIRSVVWTQEEDGSISDKTLADVCLKQTHTARKMALCAATADELVAHDKSAAKRFIEI